MCRLTHHPSAAGAHKGSQSLSQPGWGHWTTFWVGVAGGIKIGAETLATYAFTFWNSLFTAISLLVGGPFCLSECFALPFKSCSLSRSCLLPTPRPHSPPAMLLWPLIHVDQHLYDQRNTFMGPEQRHKLGPTGRPEEQVSPSLCPQDHHLISSQQGGGAQGLVLLAAGKCQPSFWEPLTTQLDPHSQLGLRAAAQGMATRGI